MVLIDYHIHVTSQCFFFGRYGNRILGLRLGLANIFAEDP